VERSSAEEDPAELAKADAYFEMPGRNAVSIGDVTVEFLSRAEVVIARPAVVANVLLLMPAPLPALMALVGSAVMALVGSLVMTLVGSVVMARIGVARLVITGSAMAVVVVMTRARPCRTGSEQ
jgi:hypothetical protein